jgi:hypothetical protein
MKKMCDSRAVKSSGSAIISNDLWGADARASCPTRTTRFYPNPSAPHSITDFTADGVRGQRTDLAGGDARKKGGVK